MEDMSAYLPIPARVADEEYIDRVLFSPSFFEEDGSLAPTAFYLRPKEKYVSVRRDAYCDINEAVAAFRPRANGDKAVGYAQLLTESVRALSNTNPVYNVTLEVEGTPTLQSPAHAGIFFRCNAQLTSENDSYEMPLLMFIQKELVKVSIVHRISEGNI